MYNIKKVEIFSKNILTIYKFIYIIAIEVEKYSTKKGGHMARELRQFDYKELKTRIFNKFGTQAAFAKYLGITPNALTRKLENKNYFT